MTRVPTLTLPLALALALTQAAVGQDAPPAKKPEVAFPSGEVEKAELRIEVKAPKPGEVRHEQGEMRLDMKATVDMGGQTQDLEKSSKATFAREVTITGSEADGTVTSLKVKFTKFSEDESTGDADPEEQQKLVGKAWSVDVAKDGLEIKDEAGEKVEDAFVQRQVQLVVRTVTSEAKSGYQAALPKEGPLTPGQKLELPAQAVRALFELEEQDALEHKEFVYKGKRTIGGRTCGVFDLRATFSDGDKGVKLILGGEVALDAATGRTLLVHLGGKVELSLSEPDGPKVSGGGSLSLKVTAEVK